jgi:hypothetical protein
MFDLIHYFKKIIMYYLIKSLDYFKFLSIIQRILVIQNYIVSIRVLMLNPLILIYLMINKVIIELIMLILITINFNVNLI